jgi:hypothetical protein
VQCTQERRVSLVLRVGGTKNLPRRLKANLADEDLECPVCIDIFTKGQAIRFSFVSKEPIHKRACWNRYLASLVVYYQLGAVEIARDLGLSARTAFRITSVARQMEDVAWQQTI